MAALPPGSTFQPLMTCYLTDDTDPDDVERGFREGVFTGVKLYPAHATTNSAAGVTDHRKIMPVLERMEKLDMPFLMHGEDVDHAVDIFDREASFIDRYLSKWVKQFPGLRMILEHLSSKNGVDFVRSAAPQVGGTITPYHMVLTRTDWLGWGSAFTCTACRSSKPKATARRCARQQRQVRPAISFAPTRRRIRWPARCGRRGARPVQRPGLHREPTPRCSRRRVRSTSSRPLPRSTDRATTSSRSIPAPSRSRNPPGPRRGDRSRRPGRAALVYRGGETIEMAGGGLKRANGEWRLASSE